MSSKGGYTAAPPPRQGGDRFYNAPALRRHQQLLLQQQMLQRQLLQQQQLQQQRLLQRRRGAAAAPESSSSAAAEAERREEGDVASTAVALAVPAPIGRGSGSNLTNLDRLMESVTPFIQARFLPEANPWGRRAREVESLPFFYLEDLWEFFCEWSYYGAGVPLLLNGKDRIQQYYVPFLSGLQLYIDPSNPSSRFGGPNDNVDAESNRLTSGAGSSDFEGDKRAKSILDLNMQRLNKLSLGDKSVISSASSEVANSRGPSFQFLEYEQPYNRRPLADKISLLASQHPELSKYKTCDLLPSSWICVAWYPIYRIPVGPTLQDLEASFLTFHSLSTQPRGIRPARFHAPNTRSVRGNSDPTAKISLPVFALASYKLQGSIVSPAGPHECEQENSLLKAAESWLKGLEVMLPDYQFFRAHYSQRR